MSIEITKIPDINPKWSDNPDVTLGDRYPDFNDSIVSENVYDRIFGVPFTTNKAETFGSIIENLTTHNKDPKNKSISVWMSVNSVMLLVFAGTKINNTMWYLHTKDYRGRPTYSNDGTNKITSIDQATITVMVDLNDINSMQVSGLNDSIDKAFKESLYSNKDEEVTKLFDLLNNKTIELRSKIFLKQYRSAITLMNTDIVPLSNDESTRNILMVYDNIYEIYTEIWRLYEQMVSSFFPKEFNLYSPIKIVPDSNIEDDNIAFDKKEAAFTLDEANAMLALFGLQPMVIAN